MLRLRRWAVTAGVLGGLYGVWIACRGVNEEPSAREREARAEVLRNLMASREKAPDPQELEAQRRDLQAEVGSGREVDGLGQEEPAASLTGTVAWVGDDELLVRDTSGVERELRIQDGTRFRREEREVSRRTVEEGAQVRVSYGVEQGEWVAREVELLRPPALAPPH